MLNMQHNKKSSTKYKLKAQNKNVNKNNGGVTRYYENMSHI